MSKEYRPTKLYNLLLIPVLSAILSNCSGIKTSSYKTSSDRNADLLYVYNKETDKAFVERINNIFSVSPCRFAWIKDTLSAGTFRVYIVSCHSSQGSESLLLLADSSSIVSISRKNTLEEMLGYIEKKVWEGTESDPVVRARIETLVRKFKEFDCSVFDF